MTLEELLCENSGLLSRMKEHDGNDILAKIIDICFNEELKDGLLQDSHHQELHGL